MSQYPPGPPANYPPGGQPGGPPPAQPGWGQQPPPQPPQQPGWGQQPPPQQPGWGQPGQPGPPGYPGGGQPGGQPGGGGGNGAKVLIGVVVVAVIAVGAFFLLSGDDSASASSPTDAVESFFSAVQDGDCGRAIDLITEESWSEGGSLSREEALADCESEVGAGGFGGGLGGEIESVELVSEQGDSATVSVTGTGEMGSFTVPVVKEGGSWKIDFMDADFGASAPSDGGAGDLPTDGEIPDLTVPEDFDPSDITLPEDFDPSDIDCSILDDPELIEACEAGLDAGFGD